MMDVDLPFFNEKDVVLVLPAERFTRGGLDKFTLNSRYFTRTF